LVREALPKVHGVGLREGLLPRLFPRQAARAGLVGTDKRHGVVLFVESEVF